MKILKYLLLTLGFGIIFCVTIYCRIQVNAYLSKEAADSASLNIIIVSVLGYSMILAAMIIPERKKNYKDFYKEQKNKSAIQFKERTNKESNLN